MAPKVEAVCDAIVLGEGPHWDHEAKLLYYVDIKSSTVHRYNPITKQQTVAKVEGETVSLIVPIAGRKDEFIISQGRDLSIMTWDGVSKVPSKVETYLTVENEEKNRDNRINDGKADPTGRLWAGTMGKELGNGKFVEGNGSLFSINKKTAETHVTEISIGNGLAWSHDIKTMFYIDSLALKVEAFDFNSKQGTISDRRTVFDFVENKIAGFPDGMSIDTNGNLWVACFSGAQIVHIDPANGKLLQKVAIPALQVTSIAFGGDNLDEMYVTTANMEMTEGQKAQFPLAGSIFKVTGLGVNGLPGVAVNL